MQAVPACPGCPGEKSIGLSFFPDVRPGLRPLCSGFMCFDARCNQSVHALSLIVPLQAAFLEMLRKPQQRLSIASHSRIARIELMNCNPCVRLKNHEPFTLLA